MGAESQLLKVFNDWPDSSVTPPFSTRRGLEAKSLRGKKAASDEKRSALGRIGRRHLATFLAITASHQTTFSKKKRIQGS